MCALRRAVVGFCLWPVVKSMDAAHDVAQLLGQADGPGAPTIRAARMFVPCQLHLEGLGEISSSSGQNDGSRSRVGVRDCQSMSSGERCHPLDIRGVGAVTGRILL